MESKIISLKERINERKRIKKERELMSEKLSKYIAFCNYFDKLLIVLSETNSSISIASFVTVIGTPVGIASASISLTFLLSTGLAKSY